MTLHARSPSTAAAACADCGAPASGNFCSSCGADLRESSLSFLGRTAAPVRRSFPAGYLSFALAGIAVYLLLIVPIVIRQVAPPGTNVSESMLTLMKVLSQVGVYV